MKKGPSFATFLASMFVGLSFVTASETVSFQIDTKPHDQISQSNNPYYDNYADLRVRCENYITDLKRIYAVNMFKANKYGKLSEAVTAMTAALVSKANNFGHDYQAKANPNTMIAIVEAAKLARASIAAVDAIPKQIQKDALKLKIVSNLMTFVFDAYEELDQEYFYVRVEKCRKHGGCYQVGSALVEDLDSKYYRALGKVARGLLEVYLNNNQIAGTNRTELFLAAMFASSAANVLDYSNYRRDLAEPIVRLYNAASDANESLGHDLGEQWDDVPRVNNQIYQAYYEIPTWL
jgi:hypothetical protein